MVRRTKASMRSSQANADEGSRRTMTPWLVPGQIWVCDLKGSRNPDEEEEEEHGIDTEEEEHGVQKSRRRRRRRRIRVCEEEEERGPKIQARGRRQSVCPLVHSSVRGHLVDHLTDKGKKTYQGQRDTIDNQRDITPPRPPVHERTVNVITGGSKVSGVTQSAAKKHARQANWTKGETSRTSSLPEQTISFTTSESTRLLNPHHDALVISLYIANYLTKRILVDNGSSANILFLSALREMGIDESKIVRKTTVLIGFSGEQKNTSGEIELPVYAEGVNLCTRFLVIDSPSAYNVILGRPWIHEMEAVPSTYHQALRFPTKWGPKEIRGEQKDSRECYRTTMKAKPAQS
ncbi:hypothetical protein CsatA_010701 [Cannabis sativa]